MGSHKHNQLALFLSATTLALALFAFRHPYYLSICEIDHNAHNKTLEISFKIFTDDLDAALTAQSTEPLFLGTKQESKSAGRQIFTYLKSHVAFVVNDDTVTYDYVGKEGELDVTWCYVEVKGVAVLRKIEVINRLLLEQHEEQTNIVHVKTGEARKSLLLHKDKTKSVLEFP